MILLFLLNYAFAQTKNPSPVSENPPIQIPLGKPASKLNKKTNQQIILDARPFFKFSNEHVENSQPIRWEDYSDDTSLIARKLRILGISPESEVLVLGEGLNGKGEEGQIAWMLYSVGVKKVKTKSYEQYLSENKNKRSSQNWIQNPAAPIWIPKKEKEMIVKKDDTVLIDTTPGSTNKNSISWKSLLDSKGSPLSADEVKKKLNGLDLSKQTVVCGQGSAYVAFIINSSGLTGGLLVRHYEGTYDEWKK